MEARRPWHSVIEMPSYLSRAVKLMDDEERAEVVAFMAQNPEAGDIMKGTGGVRKVRIPLEGRGKSGGARVIYYFHSATIPVFLLKVFAKNEKANLLQAERNELKKLVVELIAPYKKEG